MSKHIPFGIKVHAVPLAKVACASPRLLVNQSSKLLAQRVNYVCSSFKSADIYFKIIVTDIFHDFKIFSVVAIVSHF